LATVPLGQELVSIWLILPTQRHYAVSIGQSRDDCWSKESSSQPQSLDFTRGCSYILVQKVQLHPSEGKLRHLPMSRDKFTLPDYFLLATFADFVTLPVTQTGCDTSQLSFIQEQETCLN
jgi:hypothetical protein